MAVSAGTMQLTFSVAIMQVPTSVAIILVLRLFCNYVGGIFFYTYVGGSFCCNYEGDCFWCNYAVKSFCKIYAEKVSAANIWVTIFIEIMQVGVYVAATQVVFSTERYAHDYFYCNYAGSCFRCSHVCNSFK